MWVQNMKDTDNVETPGWLMQFFDYLHDPCPLNAEFNGLLIPWKDANYVNPPYSNVMPWIEKALRERKHYNRGTIMLLRADPSTAWYKLLMESDVHIAYFNERIQFKNKGKNPNFTSMLVFI